MVNELDPSVAAEKPEGWDRLMFVVPVVTGWNVAVAVPFALLPGTMVTDAGTVPTDELELLRLTTTEAVPASGCTCTKLPLVSSWAVETLSAWLPELNDVLNGKPGPFGPAITMPDGVRLSVPVPDRKPDALAVTVPEPEVLRPYI